MSSPLVADFLATIHAPAFDRPRRGRVLMREDRIVCVTADDRVDVSLSSVRDVGVGTVPEELTGFFEDSVTIAYASAQARESIVIEARSDSMQRFRTILFKCLLGGASAQIRHPAKRGGRVLDTTYEDASLEVDHDVLVVERDGGPELAIELDRVTTFAADRERIDGRDRPLISVDFLEEESVVTARIAPGDERVCALLQRYLTIEYRRVHQDVIGLELDDAIIQALVALDADATDLDGMLTDEDQEHLLERLEAEELITRTDDGLDLTRRGRIATKEHFDTVN